ncbi:hypothetical protein [Streptomyces sp. NPDC029554]|uniref:hypothetical protein n=1 Tax=Streptomyces sp. NPDC029554 TaxID=3155126 RepID=UPI00340BE73D
MPIAQNVLTLLWVNHSQGPIERADLIDGINRKEGQAREMGHIDETLEDLISSNIITKVTHRKQGQDGFEINHSYGLTQKGEAIIQGFRQATVAAMRPGDPQVNSQTNRPLPMRSEAILPQRQHSPRRRHQ